MKKLDLPCPRLQFKWIKDGATWSKAKCIYSLVLPLDEDDIRAENEDGKRVRDELEIKIGTTEVTRYGTPSPPIYSDGVVETPYRDGTHARLDNASLGGNLPVIAICGDVFTVIEKD